jgi:hypothetical protein
MFQIPLVINQIITKYTIFFKKFNKVHDYCIRLMGAFLVVGNNAYV